MTTKIKIETSSPFPGITLEEREELIEANSFSSNPLDMPMAQTDDADPDAYDGDGVRRPSLAQVIVDHRSLVAAELQPGEAPCSVELLCIARALRVAKDKTSRKRAIDAERHWCERQLAQIRPCDEATVLQYESDPSTLQIGIALRSQLRRKFNLLNQLESLDDKEIDLEKLVRAEVRHLQSLIAQVPETTHDRTLAEHLGRPVRGMKRPVLFNVRTGSMTLVDSTEIRIAVQEDSKASRARFLAEERAQQERSKAEKRRKQDQEYVDRLAHKMAKDEANSDEAKLSRVAQRLAQWRKTA